MLRFLFPLVVVLCLAVPAAVLAGPLAVQEEYVDESGVDLSRTDARLIPAGPGLVELPVKPSSVSPEAGKLAVCTPERLRVWLRGPGGLLKVFDQAVPSAGSACLAGGKLYVAKEDGFSVYHVTPAGLGPAGPGLSGLSGVKAVAVGRAGRVYLVFADRVRCYVPSSTGYTESASGALVVPGVTAISADPGSGAVIVAVGKAVRFFVPSGDRMAEVSRGCVLPADVDGLAISPGGSEYRVLAGGVLRVYRVTANGVSLSSSRVLGSAALRVGASRDAVPVLTGPSGVQGNLRAGAAEVPAAALSDSSFQVGRYRWRAVLVSRLFVTDAPVEKVRLKPEFAALPAGASVSWEVSTDDGASWTPVPPETVTPVPPGDRVRYRALLEGPGEEPQETPSLDRLVFVELFTSTAPAKVKLVR